MNTHGMQGLFPEPQCPPMPREFFGVTTASSGYTDSQPRKWTKDEICWVNKLKSEGWDLRSIAKSIGRTDVSVSIKLKRLGKANNTYNSDHISDKYDTNDNFLAMIQPCSVLDLYCGEMSWWKNNAKDASVVSNDTNTSFDANYHEKAEMLIHKLYYEGHKFDIVDLDPFGSAYDCFDLGVKMANKGLVITYGEMGHKRFKRTDFVSRYYGINTMDQFTIQRLIDETQKIARRSKKELKPVFVKEWNRICRVYYSVEKLKITEQWDKAKTIEL